VPLYQKVSLAGMFAAALNIVITFHFGFTLNRQQERLPRKDHPLHFWGDILFNAVIALFFLLIFFNKISL
jgi:hypothetical protein